MGCQGNTKGSRWGSSDGIYGNIREYTGIDTQECMGMNTGNEHGEGVEHVFHQKI